MYLLGQFTAEVQHNLTTPMRVPNQALERRRVQFPTVDCILHKMEGSTIFTGVDLSQGYLQISLAKESRQITAFQTPDNGPYQFKRLIMGASPSGEYFHEIIHNMIKHIPNCQNISDNISGYGRKSSPNMQSNLTCFFKPLRTVVSPWNSQNVHLQSQRSMYSDT